MMSLLLFGLSFIIVLLIGVRYRDEHDRELVTCDLHVHFKIRFSECTDIIALKKAILFNKVNILEKSEKLYFAGEYSVFCYYQISHPGDGWPEHL